MKSLTKSFLLTGALLTSSAFADTATIKYSNDDFDGKKYTMAIDLNDYLNSDNSNIKAEGIKLKDTGEEQAPSDMLFDQTGMTVLNSSFKKVKVIRPQGKKTFSISQSASDSERIYLSTQDTHCTLNVTLDWRGAGTISIYEGVGYSMYECSAKESQELKQRLKKELAEHGGHLLIAAQMDVFLTSDFLLGALKPNKVVDTGRSAEALSNDAEGSSTGSATANE